MKGLQKGSSKKDELWWWFIFIKWSSEGFTGVFKEGWSVIKGFHRQSADVPDWAITFIQSYTTQLLHNIVLRETPPSKMLHKQRQKLKRVCMHECLVINHACLSKRFLPSPRTYTLHMMLENIFPYSTTKRLLLQWSYRANRCKRKC